MLPGETSTPLPVAAEAYTPPDAPPCSCQKARRRSSRLIFKERSLSNSRAIQDGPMGFFEILPVEMIYNILYELSIVDLSILTIVSKAVRGLVECFMDSKRGEDRLLLRVSLHHPACQEHHASLMQHFRRLGVLHKRVTCLYTTRDRLRIMEQFIRKLDLLSCLSCSNHCLALTCYGRFLHTVIAGWDEMECLRVYAIINSHVQRRLTQVLQSAHGCHGDDELYLRLFYRRVLLDQCEHQLERAFWLSRMLKPLPMVHQARMLYLLFGPVCFQEDGAVWLEMGDAESNTPASTVVLAELGSAIKTLHNYCREWTEDDIIGVIEEVTALPETWTPENVARLLTLCGENICVKLLGSKAINGRLEELAEVIVHLAKVCVKEHYSTQWVIQVTRRVCRYMDIPADRRSFLMAIPQTFKEFLMDMHDDAGEDTDPTDLYYMLEAQTAFQTELMKVAFADLLNS
ncbi:F-box only protein 47-like isoform X1 [Branchiostoma floridae x Branchiostoma japonicum]